VDLTAHRYEEHEYLVHGTANLYEHDAQLVRRVHTAEVPFTTRILVRRPTVPGAFNGVVQVEPLHPSADNPNVWTQMWRHIVRNGQAWVGVTVVPANAGFMATSFDPDRYGSLVLSDEGLGWDIVGQVTTALSDGAGFFGGPTQRLYLSGRSYTGTFCRVFAMDGFHEDHRLADGRPAIDGYVIGISSGGFEQGGYHQLSSVSPRLPIGDPRRVVGFKDVPVIELLSENESETHAGVLRDDGDAADDRYRLYQVAGASHISMPGRTDRPPNQYQATGQLSPYPAMIETPSTFRTDLVAAAVYDHLDRWVADGVVPPRADRLVLGDRDGPGRRGHRPEAVPLVRDEHGNAMGGIRSTYVDVPIASYYPHSTPENEQAYQDGPLLSAAMLGDLLGSMEPFSEEKLRNLYGTHEHYVELVTARADELVKDGWLLPPDVEAVEAEAIAAPLP
jgi:hypothetical protein